MQGAGENCTAAGQCVDNAECSNSMGGVCQCLPDFYAENGHCVVRKQVPESCKDTGECVANAVCSPSKKVCECSEGFYADNGRCAGSK